MPTNYQRGRAFEYRTRDALLRRGAAFVIRAAQSKGAADLAAFWRHPQAGKGLIIDPWPEPWLVQCKYSIHGSGSIPVPERKALFLLAREAGCKPVIARPGKDGKGVVFEGVDITGKLRGLD